ncbi:TPA: hypothetical protein EYG96_02870 [Candidatus Gracilibacteria bacterium]|nr:hypothetical protein [Candidatus Peregrinibacteria bacterium]HIQ56956.1 hypothetical protein [Candidatus Gracilibacteria bacterium]
MNKKVGIWIVLIFTSLALVIPSVAIVYSLLTQSSGPVSSVVVNSDDVKISVQTVAPIVTSLEDVVPVIESEL